MPLLEEVVRGVHASRSIVAAAPAPRGRSGAPRAPCGRRGGSAHSARRRPRRPSPAASSSRSAARSGRGRRLRRGRRTARGAACGRRPAPPALPRERALQRLRASCPARPAGRCGRARGAAPPAARARRAGGATRPQPPASAATAAAPPSPRSSTAPGPPSPAAPGAGGRCPRGSAASRSGDVRAVRGLVGRLRGGPRVPPSPGVLRGGRRDGRGRVEGDPADVGEERLDPGVGVEVAHDVLAAVGVEAPGGEARGDPRGHARHPQQQRHRPGELLAVALVGVEEERVERDVALRGPLRVARALLDAAAHAADEVAGASEDASRSCWASAQVRA